MFVALIRALRAIHSCQSKEVSNLGEQHAVDLLEQVCQDFILCVIFHHLSATESELVDFESQEVESLLESRW